MKKTINYLEVRLLNQGLKKLNEYCTIYVYDDFDKNLHVDLQVSGTLEGSEEIAKVINEMNLMKQFAEVFEEFEIKVEYADVQKEEYEKMKNMVEQICTLKCPTLLQMYLENK